jgi:hypothetical protein
MSKFVALHPKKNWGNFRGNFWDNFWDNFWGNIAKADIFLKSCPTNQPN